MNATIKHQSLLLALLAVLTAGCTGAARQEGQSTTANIILHNNAVGDMLVFSLNQTVVLRQCRPGVLAAQSCAPVAPDVVMAMQSYIQALAGQFAVDYDLVGLGSVERLTQEIADTQQAINSGTLSPEEIIKAQTYLQRLQANDSKLRRVFAVISHLGDGQDISFNVNFSDDFTKVVAAFGSLKPAPVTGFTADADTGLAWMSLGYRCWYDANDLQRGGQCEGPLEKGCRLTYGTSWALPTTGQVQTTLLHGFKVPKMTAALENSSSGVLMQDGSVRCLNYSNQLTTCGWKNPDYSPSAWAMCVAKVRDVDPDGDVDGDGIINRVDLCNRLPADRTAPVHRDGAWIGCAGGQTKD